MLVQAMYNIVDSVFVSRINENALTAVTLAFPLQQIIISIGSGTGVGINALLSKALGEKDFEKSDKAANMGIMLIFFSYLLFVVLGFTIVSPFIRSQTGDPEIAQYGITYLSIICFLSIGALSQMTLERLLQSTGKTVYSMISQMSGALTNIIFDPIMIFGLFGFPRLGVAGAAYATVFGQTVASCLALFFNLKFNREIHFSLKSIIKPDKFIIGRIYAVGVPTILMMSIGAVMTYSFNRILIAFSSTATAVFGVYFKLQSFFFMPIFGLNNGLIPVMAYNFGARNRDRIREALRFSLCLAVGIMAVGTLIFQLFPGNLLDLFNASDNMKEIGLAALRIISIHFPVAGASIALGSVFQAFSKPVYSLIISICRQLLVLIPAAWLLSLTGVVTNIWWAFLIAEAVSFTLSAYFYKRINDRIIAKL
ncbi:MAG: MATE family efflux transporter [Lachnospiraceae bacterium]|nr:MATE family efflux transporter [Lachnospiraceae bacterium]